jgi:hypothetical protein
MQEPKVSILVNLNAIDLKSIEAYWHKHQLRNRASAFREILRNFQQSESGSYAMIALESADELAKVNSLLATVRGVKWGLSPDSAGAATPSSGNPYSHGSLFGEVGAAGTPVATGNTERNSNDNDLFGESNASQAATSAEDDAARNSDGWL